jgi:mlo protein
LVAVQQAKSEGKGTSLSIVLLHRDHQDEFVRERAKGFWMKLAVVSWIVSHLLNQSYYPVQLNRI